MDLPALCCDDRPYLICCLPFASDRTHPNPTHVLCVPCLCKRRNLLTSCCVCSGETGQISVPLKDTSTPREVNKSWKWGLSRGSTMRTQIPKSKTQYCHMRTPSLGKATLGSLKWLFAWSPISQKFPKAWWSLESHPRIVLSIGPHTNLIEHDFRSSSLFETIWILIIDPTKAFSTLLCSLIQHAYQRWFVGLRIASVSPGLESISETGPGYPFCTRQNLCLCTWSLQRVVGQLWLCPYLLVLTWCALGTILQFMGLWMLLGFQQRLRDGGKAAAWHPKPSACMCSLHQVKSGSKM